MTLPRSVADVLSRHVTFEIEAIDRMYLNVYQPRLQHTGGAVADLTPAREDGRPERAEAELEHPDALRPVDHHTGARGARPGP